MGDPLPAILIESGRVDQQEALELEVGEGIFSFHVVEVPSSSVSIFTAPTSALAKPKKR